MVSWRYFCCSLVINKPFDPYISPCLQNWVGANSISFESNEQRLIGFSFKKTVAIDILFLLDEPLYQ